MRRLLCVLALVTAAACGSAATDDAPGGQAADPTHPGATDPSGRGPSDGDGGATGAADGGAGGEDAGPKPRPYQAFDLNHVLSTGQSNAVANDAKPVISTTQPYSNVMFDVGVMTGGGCDKDGCTSYQKPTSLVPLVEGDTFFAPVETMSAGLANEATKLATQAHGKPSHDVLVSLHGRSGYNYLCLRKGGCDWWPERGYTHPFAEAMMQVTDAKALAEAAGKSYVVRAVTAIHGEHDHYADTGGYSYFPMPRTDGTGVVHDYGEGLEEWQRDYESSVQAITGQTIPIPLLVSQYSHWNDAPHTKIAFLQLDAHVRSKGKVVVVGPTYQMSYTESCLHFLNHSERWLGEYFAKAYARIVFDGLPWEPLRPVGATVQGAVVTVKYHVPVPPLVIDTQRVTEAPAYGFELADATGAPPAITQVAVTGPDTIALTLSAPPGPGARLRYAYTFSGCMGGKTSARGNVRDSDATVSQHGYDLFNWSVHFDMPL